jgi:tetratricopeptide (TPR) repeat protein
LGVAQRWIAVERTPASIACVRDGYRSLGSALGRGGKLSEALESYRNAYVAASELQQRTDVRQDQTYNNINVLTAMGDLLGAPDDPNLNDPKAALVNYQNALTLAERLAANDVNNVNSRRNVAVCYQRMGMILMESVPAQALDYYQKSLAIADEMLATDPRNAEYRYHTARAEMGIGETLRNLHRYAEAIPHLNRAIEVQNAVAAVSPERIWNLRVLSRSLVVKGQSEMALGDLDGSFNTLREALATAEKMLARAPASFVHQMDRANAFEAIGAHYQLQAKRAGTAERKTELNREARQQFEASLTIWKDWTKQNVAVAFAKGRENQVKAILTAIH